MRGPRDSPPRGAYALWWLRTPHRDRLRVPSIFPRPPLDEQPFLALDEQPFLDEQPLLDEGAPSMSSPSSLPQQHTRRTYPR